MSTLTAVEELVSELATCFSEGRIELPLLSQTVQRVVAATSDEKTDLPALAEIIRHDQALASHILRRANSPLYAPRSPIVSLSHAITRLGMLQIRDLAVLVSLEPTLFAARGPKARAELGAMFSHAVVTALFAREIARKRRLNVDDAFLAGLLHDVGKPIVLHALLERRGAAATAVRADRALLWQVVERMHAEAGVALCARWCLPGAIADVIRAHHDAACTIPAVGIVQLADELAIHAVEASPFDQTAVLSLPAVARLNLYPDDLADLLTMGADFVEKGRAAA